LSQPETQKDSNVAALNDSGSQHSERDRVKASIENWKRKLLDLTKRNRALHFRMNKVSTIAIVDEQPAEVFRQLYLRERTMRFKAAPEGDEEVIQANDSKSPSEMPSQTPAVPVQTGNLPFGVAGNAISDDVRRRISW
jgi:hypothetical protein